DRITLLGVDPLRQGDVVTAGVHHDVVAAPHQGGRQLGNVHVLPASIHTAQMRHGAGVFGDHRDLQTRSGTGHAHTSSITRSHSARYRDSPKCAAAKSLAALPAVRAAHWSTTKPSSAWPSVVMSALTTPASPGTTRGVMVEATATIGMPRNIAWTSDRPSEVQRAVCR